MATFLIPPNEKRDTFVNPLSNHCPILSDHFAKIQSEDAVNQHLRSKLVGMTGLEPATSRPPDACANQLRYIPNGNATLAG